VNSPKSLVTQDDLVAVVTLKARRMDCCFEPNQYQHNYPSLEDLMTFQAIDVQKLNQLLESQTQNFLLDHLATQSACHQVHLHWKTPDKMLVNCHKIYYFMFSTN